MTVSKIRLNGTDHDIRAKYLIQSSSSDAVSAEFSARTVSEDAIANIQKIYGNTIKWNQLNRVQNNSATITGDTLIDNKVTGYTYHREANHKYLYRVRLTTLTANDAIYLMGSSRTVGIKNNELYAEIYENGNTTQDRNNTFTLRSYGTGTIGWTDLCIHDLTEMYGAGNEPTIAEFEATYPAGFSPYTTTTLRSVNATAVQSKDTNDNVIGNCNLNIPTLTGKLNGAGSSVVIFPDGMGYNGTNRDELINGKATRKLGFLDLGTLTYTYSSSTTTFAAAHGLSSIAKYGAVAVCANYTQVSSIGSSTPDKVFAFMSSWSGVNYIHIKDTSYNNAAAFKTAMSGVLLIYDLATSQEYVLDNALQLQYPVVAGGTEMVLPTTGTAPMKMDVIYGNAADAAATMSQNFISVDSMKEFLAALGTQMGGTWSMGYENGKHTFTFTSN